MIRSVQGARRLLLVGWSVSQILWGAGASEPWPQFRGPDGQGISQAKHLPVHWSETENLDWKTFVHGRAWSSPVVWGDQIWLSTATPDGHELYAVCVDLETGRIVHDLKLFQIEHPQFAHAFNSYASPTPVIEKGRVYLTFGSPGTACLETGTGRVLWTRTDIQCNHFRGAGSSPILFEDRLIMNFDGSDFQFVVALDKGTGQTIWKTNRSIDFRDLTPEGKPAGDGDWRKAFSTPQVARFDGKPVLLSIGSKCLYAYDPRTGSELWRTESRVSHSAATRPTVSADRVFYCTGFSKGELWCVRPGGHGNVTDTHVVWKAKRGIPNKPSLILVGGLIFMIHDGGVASCVRAATGDYVWRERVGGNYSASPLYADGKIYFFSEEGKATVIKAGGKFVVLATNTLSDGFMASPAVAGRSLILRTKTHLYRVTNRSTARDLR